MIEAEDYRPLDKLIQFKVAIIKQSTYHENWEPIMSVYTRYGKNFSNVTKDMRPRTRRKEKLDWLEWRVTKSKCMLVEIFYGHCASGVLPFKVLFTWLYRGTPTKTKSVICSLSSIHKLWTYMQTRQIEELCKGNEY